MTGRRQARILAMQALCQLETLGDAFAAQLDAFLRDESPPEDVVDYARRLVTDAAANLDTLDEKIQEAAEHWELKRMAMVDRNILRIAACELFFRPDVPPRVVIDEAVELGKNFGAADSSGFINGVLDAILKRRTATATTTADPPKLPPDTETPTPPTTQQ